MVILCEWSERRTDRRHMELMICCLLGGQKDTNLCYFRRMYIRHLRVWKSIFSIFDIYVLHNLIRCYKIYRLVRGILHRGVAQVVECLLREQEAVGSSPATPTNNFS